MLTFPSSWNPTNISITSMARQEQRGYTLWTGGLLTSLTTFPRKLKFRGVAMRFTPLILYPYLYYLSIDPSLIPAKINPFMPTVAFNICCPRDAVSRTANVGTWLRKRNGGKKWVNWASGISTEQFEH